MLKRFSIFFLNFEIWDAEVGRKWRILPMGFVYGRIGRLSRIWSENHDFHPFSSSDGLRKKIQDIGSRKISWGIDLWGFQSDRMPPDKVTNQKRSKSGFLQLRFWSTLLQSWVPLYNRFAKLVSKKSGSLSFSSKKTDFFLDDTLATPDGTGTLPTFSSRKVDV